MTSSLEHRVQAVAWSAGAQSLALSQLRLDRAADEDDRLRAEARRRYREITDDEIANMERMKRAGHWSHREAERMFERHARRLAEVPCPPKRDPSRVYFGGAFVRR